MASSSETPRTLDHYRLLLPLGEGGMGEVWAARDLSAPTLRIVALKTTKQEGQEAAKVLFDEARIASLIEHPNVCRVHELGRASGVQYMVMDWCDGASLFDLLQAQPNRAISHGLAVKIVSEVALGLHAAHELLDEAGNSMHVVHRDVSPQNVLISSQGQVTISDFGVAKAKGQVHQATATGEVKGKLSYMAPEQVRSKYVDRRADIFALGCVLYMATLGKRPFSGADAVALMYQILEAKIQTPREIDPNYPDSLERILLRSLSREPEHRYQTAHEFHQALEGWLRAEGKRVTAKDIALLLDHSLGSGVRARNAKIRALGQDEASVTIDTAQAEPPASDEPTERAEHGSVTIATGTITKGAFESMPPRRSRLPWPWLVGAMALAGAAFALRPPTPPSAPGAGAEPARSATASAPAVDVGRAGVAAPGTSQTQEVRVVVRVNPPTAQILIDGEAVGRGQYEVAVAPSSAERRLVVLAPGYTRLERELRLDRDQELSLSLEREAPPAGVKGVRPAAVQRVPATGSATPTPPTGTTPTRPPEKKPRPIDTDNPFGDSP